MKTHPLFAVILAGYLAGAILGLLSLRFRNRTSPSMGKRFFTRARQFYVGPGYALYVCGIILFLSAAALQITAILTKP